MADIQGKLEAFMKHEQSRDMNNLLGEMKREVTWKNSARCSVLARYYKLYVELAALCPQGIMPPKKTTMALIACHKDKAIHYNGQNINDWSDEISSLLRACFAKYREIHHDDNAHRRCVSKVLLFTCLCGCSHTWLF